MKSILKEEPIHIFNNGNMRRDFTYITDIIRGAVDIVKDEPKDVRAEIYNIGHGEPIELIDFIKCMEDVVGVKGKYIFEGMKLGDVTCTYANVSKLEKDFGYSPKVGIREGLEEMFYWFKEYMK